MISNSGFTPDKMETRDYTVFASERFYVIVSVNCIKKVHQLAFIFIDAFDHYVKDHIFYLEFSVFFKVYLLCFLLYPL